MAADSALHRWSYDVFLSFRGEDTGKSFSDHLYAALCRIGVNTFRDSEELRRGEDISTELSKAIEDSRISIIVCSETYASSSWCLQELVKILDCKQRLNQVVLPVFYHVDPSDVRKQTGSFGDALTRHQQRFSDEKVNEWRSALTKVANFAGWDLQNVADGYGSKFVEKIIETVLLELNCTYMNVAKHPVGIDTRAKSILSLLQLEKNDVRMIGIHGIGGIGKTTLCKSVFNQLFRMFEGSCFLANIRSEASETHNGVARLQEKLLCDILKKKRLRVENADRGIGLIKERLGSKRVLIVLDDVDHKSQLDSLVGERDWFCSGSRVIITTQDVHLLSELSKDERYKMEGLSSDESLQLFSLHAFGCYQPPNHFSFLSNDIVEYTAGLPLALVVLGSHFRGRLTEAEWRNDFNKLRRIPHVDVQKILRISYDSLDDDVQNIFLDITCFFIGSDMCDVVPVLNGCGFFAESGITTLVDRSLLTVGEDDKLQMHDLVQDMGREVARMESPRDVGKRSRVFLPDDVCKVLKDKKGTEAIEGMVINSRMFEQLHLSTKLFSKMTQLRILKIEGELDLKGSFKYLSKDLRWFSWRNCQLTQIPSSFRLNKLVHLDMEGSDIQEFQLKLQHFECLEILKLNGCKRLKTIPDFTCARSLQRLSLVNCQSLVEMQESIGDLESLVELDLTRCLNLRELPNSICKLKALKKLSLGWCSNIRLPADLGKLQCLRELNVDMNAFARLSFHCGDLSSLKRLRVYNDELHNIGLPEISVGALSSVEHIYIYGSRSDVWPYNLSHWITALTSDGSKNSPQPSKTTDI